MVELQRALFYWRSGLCVVLNQGYVNFSCYCKFWLHSCKKPYVSVKEFVVHVVAQTLSILDKGRNATSTHAVCTLEVWTKRHARACVIMLQTWCLEAYLALIDQPVFSAPSWVDSATELYNNKANVSLAKAQITKKSEGTDMWCWSPKSCIYCLHFSCLLLKGSLYLPPNKRVCLFNEIFSN